LEDKNKARTSINRSSEYNEVVDILVSRGGDRVFKAMYELLCFAAYIGVNNEKRLKIPTKFKAEPIAINLFERADLDKHFWTINLYSEPDIARFINYNDCIETFEEYANGGMEILSKRLRESPTDTLGTETLLTMLLKVTATFQKKSDKQVRKITF
jgi:dnd system-associated protein 4|tara:strand:+ start:5227 stop:5694 length:468 start_codon:yes stop_codon:yes gene_type:complete